MSMSAWGRVLESSGCGTWELLELWAVGGQTGALLLLLLPPPVNWEQHFPPWLADDATSSVDSLFCSTTFPSGALTHSCACSIHGSTEIRVPSELFTHFPRSDFFFCSAKQKEDEAATGGDDIHQRTSGLPPTRLRARKTYGGFPNGRVAAGEGWGGKWGRGEKKVKGFKKPS